MHARSTGERREVRRSLSSIQFRMGLLKGSTNRVRTSEALRLNSIWEQAIGVQSEHKNSASRFLLAALDGFLGIQTDAVLCFSCANVATSAQTRRGCSRGQAE